MGRFDGWWGGEVGGCCLRRAVGEERHWSELELELGCFRRLGRCWGDWHRPRIGRRG